MISSFGHPSKKKNNSSPMSIIMTDIIIFFSRMMIFTFWIWHFHWDANYFIWHHHYLVLLCNLTFFFGKVHIYIDQWEEYKKQMNRLEKLKKKKSSQHKNNNRKLNWFLLIVANWAYLSSNTHFNQCITFIKLSTKVVCIAIDICCCCIAFVNLDCNIAMDLSFTLFFIEKNTHNTSSKSTWVLSGLTKVLS